MNIANHGVKSLSWNGVVSAGSDLSSETIVENKLAGNLGGNSNTQDHPRELESIADNIEISSSEDQSHNGSVSDTRGAWIDSLVLLYMDLSN